MKKLIYIALSCLMAFSMSACSQSTAPTQDNQSSSTIVSTPESSTDVPSTVEITHKYGTVQVPYDAKNIAVLDLAVLDVLDALNLGDRVTGVPKSSSVSYLTSYTQNDEIVNLGTLKEIDMEALYALRPDVIFIGGRLASEYENISKIAPTVFINPDNTSYMESLKYNVKTIASFFGLEDKAITLLDGFDSRIAALNKTASGKNAIISLVSSGAMSTLGNGSRCSLISNEVGFENLANDVDSTHGNTASFELLLDKNPNYIFVLDRDTATNAQGAKAAKEIMENEIVMKTQAYKDNNVIYLTPDVWYLSEGGITATDTMIKDLEMGLNK